MTVANKRGLPGGTFAIVMMATQSVTEAVFGCEGDVASKMLQHPVNNFNEMNEAHTHDSIALKLQPTYKLGTATTS